MKLNQAERASWGISFDKASESNSPTSVLCTLPGICKKKKKKKNKQGFPLEYYFRGHVSPLTLILMGIWSYFGGHLDLIEHASSIKSFGDRYVSFSKILGDIWNKKGQNLVFF